MHKFWPLVFWSFCGGIAIAHYYAWLSLLLFFLLLILAASYYADFRPRIKLIIAIVLVGLAYYNCLTLDYPDELNEEKSVQFSGRLKDFPSFDGQKTTFILQTEDSSPYKKKIRVVCLFPTEVKRGDTVILQGDLKPPVSPGNPGEFDYRTYLSQQGIYYSLTVKKASELQLINSQNGLLSAVDSFRYRAEQLTNQVLPQREASVLLGMILGGRQGMEEEQYSDFQKTGIVHLFSVGGLHVGFLLLLVAWLTALLRISSRNKFIAGATILMVYGTLVAWPPPVIRAVLMGVLGLLAYYSGRENSLLNALSLSGLVMLLINPQNLFNLSFQLTMLATWGLVYLFPLVRKNLTHKGWAVDIFLMPICAELPIIPLIAYQFFLFTPVSLITNILTAYLSAGAVILGFIAFFLASLLPSLGAVFLYPAGLFIEMILFIVEWVKHIPGAYVWVARPAMGIMILYFAGLAAAIIALERQQRKYLLISITVLSIFIISMLIPAGCYNRGKLEIVFIDVGQGDAILFKSPGGKFVLIDGGGSLLFDIGGKKVLPYLHYRGISRLDMMVNTHPDIDHLLGLESVAAQVPIDYMGLPKSLIDCSKYQVINKLAASNDTRIVPLSTGQHINLEEGLEIKVLNPEQDRYVGDDYNGQSVVLEVRYGEFTGLLCGDIPADNLSKILENFDVPELLIKVPHHGSKGSLLPGFYEKLHPQYAIISVGANNPFGHPNQEVLDTLNQQGIKIWRTDQDGAVVLESDGRNIRIQGTRNTNP